MNVQDISEICSTDWGLLAFLQYFKIIVTEKECDKCKRKCEISKRTDKFFFYCNKKNCGFKMSVSPKNYWFSDMHLSYEDAIYIMYFFVQNLTVNQVSNCVGISRTRVIDWFNFCQEVCILECLIQSSKIGGKGKVVEVYESVFGKRKYHKARFGEGQLVFGGIERGSNACFLVPIEKRDSATLTNIIEENIECGTTIITDSWKGYKDLEKHDYKHLTLNHSVIFKDKDTGTHTNTIKSTWSQVKLNIPSNGRSSAHLVGYLATFMWGRRYEANDKFIAFLEIIAKHFP